MKTDVAARLRENPDIAAIALILAIVIPTLDARPNAFHFSLVSRPSAERVWQRLENKMRVFEERFDRVTPQRTRIVTVPNLESE